MTGALLVAIAQLRVLTLSEALHLAETHQPQLQLAHANTDVARARIGEARSVLLPQLAGTGTYQRTTANFTQRPSVVPNQINMLPITPTFTTFNYWTFGATLSQYIWDFRAPFALGATERNLDAARASERFALVQARLNVRAAYYNARAQKALAEVSEDNLANQKRHLEQSRALVEVGRQPPIAIAQSETDVANAEVLSINAANAHRQALYSLNQAMGLSGPPDFDVASDVEPEVAGEDGDVQALIAEALKTRPDVVSLERQVSAQHLIARTYWSGYLPALSGNLALTDAGGDLGHLVWNFSASVTVNWTLFDGLLTYYAVREAKAVESGLGAQLETARQQVVVDVGEAQLAVRASRASVRAATRAVESARQQLELAEGRFTEGVGNIIELGDAQLALLQSRAALVQAEYNVSTARALLRRGLGQP